jgi:hypothetical protein
LHLGYNLNFKDGFGLLCYLPLFFAAFSSAVGRRPIGMMMNLAQDETEGKGLGILGRV